MKRIRLVFAAVLLSAVAACSSDIAGPDTTTASRNSTGTLGSGH